VAKPLEMPLPKTQDTGIRLTLMWSLGKYYLTDLGV
jgi:hypothetical protein